MEYSTVVSLEQAGDELLGRWIWPQFLTRIKDSDSEDGEEQNQRSPWQVEWTRLGDRLDAGGKEGRGF